MHVIVDGYNLLYAASDVRAEQADVERELLCRYLQAYAKRSGQRVTVVFDGTAGPNARTGDVFAGLEVVFAGPGRDADSVIVAMIEDSTSPRELMVVSSDRRITLAARRRRATVMRSHDFARLMSAVLRRRVRRRGEPREKQHGLSSEQIEYWLRQFGLPETDDDDPTQLLGPW